MEERIEEMKSNLTEENFQNLVQMHKESQERNQLRNQIREALEAGDYETVEQLRNQLMENTSECGCGMFHLRGRGSW